MARRLIIERVFHGRNYEYIYAIDYARDIISMTIDMEDRLLRRLLLILLGSDLYDLLLFIDYRLTS